MSFYRPCCLTPSTQRCSDLMHAPSRRRWAGAARQVLCDELMNHALRDIGRSNVAQSHPACEMRDTVQVNPRGVISVASPYEAKPIGRDVRGKNTVAQPCG